MKALKHLLACTVLALACAPAQAERIYNQPELDALLAPIALYPDSLLSQILMAATYPEELAAAAAWSRANPYLKGEDAVNAAQNEPWDPSVKSLLAFPEVLARMDESPQWTRDLGEAFLRQEPHVMDTVQGLRRRAQAGGTLRSDERYAVEQDGGAIVVEPRTEVIYVPYYDPYVVYGPWWWPHYRPVYWRPWPVRPVIVSTGFFFGGFDWHRHHARVIHRPAYTHITQVHVMPGRWRKPLPAEPRGRVTERPYQRVPESRRQPIIQSAPRVHREQRAGVTVREFQRVPESRRQPIIQSAPRVHQEPRMPAASGFSHNFRRTDVQRASPQRAAPQRGDGPRGDGPRGNGPRGDGQRGDGHLGKSWRGSR